MTVALVPVGLGWRDLMHIAGLQVRPRAVGVEHQRDTLISPSSRTHDHFQAPVVWVLRTSNRNNGSMPSLEYRILLMPVVPG